MNSYVCICSSLLYKCLRTRMNISNIHALITMCDHLCISMSVVMMACVFQCEHGLNDLNIVWYISMSHLFLDHCSEWEVWMSLNPVELTPVSLSACLLNRPFLNWIAASSTDNPQTMSNTDSSPASLQDIRGRHRPQKTEQTTMALAKHVSKDASR